MNSLLNTSVHYSVVTGRIFYVFHFIVHYISEKTKHNEIYIKIFLKFLISN